MKRTLFSIVALLVVISMVLAACGPTPEPTKAPEPTKVPEVEPTKEPEVPAEGVSGTGQAHLDAALAGEPKVGW